MSDASGKSPPSAGIVHTVRWSEICPWLLLFRAARVALFFRVVALALAGVLATQFGWAILESALATDAAPPLTRIVAWGQPESDASELVLGSPLVQAAGQSQRETDFGALTGALSRPLELAEQNDFVGPLIHGWAWAIQPLTRQLAARGWRLWLLTTLTGVWTISVWALFGGAIARIAALYLTRGEKIGPLVALKSAVSNWTATAGAPTAAYIGILLCLAPLVIAGLMMRLGVFAFAAGVLWFLALLLGAAALVLSVGLLIGWPLMWAATAVERSDAFDGVSRGFAYVTQRPLHLLFYVAVASALGLICQTAVSFGAEGVVSLTEGAVARGLGDQESNVVFGAGAVSADSELTVADWGARRAIHFWRTLVMGAAQAFPMAYVWSLAVGAYLLLRRHIDATEFDEISLDKVVESPPLPPLATNPETGVPAVDESAAAESPKQSPPTDDDASSEASPEE